MVGTIQTLAWAGLSDGDFLVYMCHKTGTVDECHPPVGHIRKIRSRGEDHPSCAIARMAALS